MRELPDYQTLMLPMLKILGDGNEYHVRELVEIIANQLQLTEEELSQTQPSGSSLFGGRVGWAKTYLKQAGLIEQPRRGWCKITQSGRDLLAKGLSQIDNRLLMSYPQFVEFQKKSHLSLPKSEFESSQVPVEEKISDLSLEETTPSKSPEERIEEAFAEYQNALIEEILLQVRSLPAPSFEKLLRQLLDQMHYDGSIEKSALKVGPSKEETTDFVIHEDRFGLGRIALRVNRSLKNDLIGLQEILIFIGSMAGHCVDKGIFITTSCFTKEALDYKPMNNTQLILVDGIEFVKLMIEFRIGVRKMRTYDLHEIDLDAFKEA